MKQPQTHWLRSSGFEPWCSYFYFNSHDLLLCQVRRLNLPWRHIEIFVPTILQLLICYWAMHMGLLNRVRYEVSILSINTQENIDFPKLIGICNVWYYVLRRGINFIQICTIYLSISIYECNCKQNWTCVCEVMMMMLSSLYIARFMNANIRCSPFAIDHLMFGLLCSNLISVSSFNI